MSKSYEQFYVNDLEAKLDAYRGREFELLEQLDKAGELIRGLQQENAVRLQREQEFIMEQVLHNEGSQLTNIVLAY